MILGENWNHDVPANLKPWSKSDEIRFRKYTKQRHRILAALMAGVAFKGSAKNWKRKQYRGNNSGW